MILFEPIDITRKTKYQNFLSQANRQGCEFSFANLFMWGEQQAAVYDNHLVLFTRYLGRYFYPFPSGTTDKKPVLDALLADAKERNLPFVLTGLQPEDKELVEALYPNQFIFRYDRNSFDYVYDLQDLATLAGRKFQKKRNHYKRFLKNYPNYSIVPIEENKLPIVEELLSRWYKDRFEEAPDSDFTSEQTALEKALKHWNLLEMEGILLYVEEEPVAFTIASKIDETTFDIHFEKALSSIDGAYAAINCEFAQYLLNKYPQAHYANREDDLGIPGLRKAKESYHPHHMVEKYRAYLKESTLSIGHPSSNDREALIALWQNSFGDDESFCQLFFNTAYADDHCLCTKVNERIVSVLYWMDCEYKGQKQAYFYAITTDAYYRGQGLCRQLMDEAHRLLLNNGYAGTLLVPAEESLFLYYEKLGYSVCSSFCIKEYETTCQTSFSPVDDKTYAKKRRQFLPEGGVIQEGEQLSFLAKYTQLYAEETFVATVFVKDGRAFCFEYLGEESSIPDFVAGLGVTSAIVRTPGNETPFAMFCPLSDHAFVPTYFGLSYE